MAICVLEDFENSCSVEICGVWGCGRRPGWEAARQDGGGTEIGYIS